MTAGPATRTSSCQDPDTARRGRPTDTGQAGQAGRRRPPLPSAAFELLDLAHRGLLDAVMSAAPAERYAAAHLTALRAAAAVLAVRTRPIETRRRPRSAWVLLPQVAPELSEWAAFFAAGAGKRAAAEAGIAHAVTAREADDLVRDAETFTALVETTLGILPAAVPAAVPSAG